MKHSSLIDALVDPHVTKTARILVATIIARPHLLSEIAKVETDDLPNFELQWTWGVIRNLQARGEGITIKSIEAEHARADEARETNRRLTVGREYLGKLVQDASLAPDAAVIRMLPGWADSLRRLREKKEAAVAEEDARLRTEDEIDDIALRDAEPANENWGSGNVDYDSAAFGALGLSVINGAANDERPQLTEWQREIASALADIKGALGSAKSTAREPLFSDASRLLTAEFPLAVWTVVGLMTRGGVATIGGEPKTAKTWLALELAIAIATGTKACGEFFAEAGTAAYFFAEDLDKQVRNRVRALLAGQGRTLQPNRLHVCPRGKFLDVTKDEDLAWVVASCRKLGPLDLLVLDPLRDISSAAEDKSDEMSVVMRRLRLLSDLLSCSIAIVHHAGKATESTSKRRPGQRLRGSGAIHGSTDSGIYLGNLDGDGTNVFCNVVDSEVKGARSAGRFELTLTIQDNAEGEATRAEMAVTRDVKTANKTKDRNDEDDELVFEFVRMLAIRGERFARRTLRSHDEAPIAEKRTTDALERLIESKRLRLKAGVVCLPERASIGGDS